MKQAEQGGAPNAYPLSCQMLARSSRHLSRQRSGVGDLGRWATKYSLQARFVVNMAYADGIAHRVIPISLLH
jgi:hypothetical protein